MIDTEKLHEGIKELNDGTHTQREMAKILGVGRTTITRHIKQMEAEEPGFKYNEPARTFHPSKKKQLQTETKIAMIKDLAAKGYSMNRISTEIGVRHETVSRVIKEMLASGELQEQKNIVAKERKRGKVIVPEKRNKRGQYAPPTLAPGETIKCTATIARTCVYGADGDWSGGMCRYMSVTGKSRMVICPHEACTCYSKRSKENRKLKGMF